MPPKKNVEKPKGSSTKVAVDKTFGMKNKKGAQAQKQVALIKSQASQAKTPAEKKAQAEKEAREKEKATAEKMAREMADLFKPLHVQKVPFGVDPKTVLCLNFKAGHCERGRKCKFSHDLAVERKAQKRDLYSDNRENEEELKQKDDMVDWDEEKLRQVVMSKHGNPKTTTDKVCKFFVEAVENGKYGWFWACPNGGDKCMYKHSLPPGFVLKTKEQRAAEKALMDKSPMQTLTLEDFLESERHKLSGTLTPVTPETFAAWKRSRLDKKAAEEEARQAREATGRAMFERGDWRGQGSDDESEEDEEEEEEDQQNGEASSGRGRKADWDLQRLRLETEKERQRKEEERLGGGYAGFTAQMNGIDDVLGGGERNESAEMSNGMNGSLEADVVNGAGGE